LCPQGLACDPQQRKRQKPPFTVPDSSGEPLDRSSGQTPALFMMVGE
jgi:hypothetical protein